MNLERMHVNLIEEAGYGPAIFGNGLSFGKTSHQIYEDWWEKNIFYECDKCDMEAVGEKLARHDRGHDGFLSMIHTWWDINAPRYWWQQADTYKIGKWMRSESTMHTLMNPTVPYHIVHELRFEDVMVSRGELRQKHFVTDLPGHLLDYLNDLIINGEFDALKQILPEGFLQRRIVNISYMCLKNMIIQRKTHKLPEWQYFITNVLDLVHHPKLLPQPKFYLKLRGLN